MRSFLLTQATLALAILVGQPGMALADFRLNSGQAAERPPARPPADSMAQSVPEVDGDMRPVVPASRFHVAQGFGRSVSLQFATRQIVPPAVAVRFSAGVDPASLVTWSGGQPWNRVLAAAVQPMGLRIVTGVNSVLILR